MSRLALLQITWALYFLPCMSWAQTQRALLRQGMGLAGPERAQPGESAPSEGPGQAVGLSLEELPQGRLTV